MNRLNLSRILLLIGIGIGFNSLIMTLGHVGDKTYLLIPEFTKGSTHAWYHAFREGVQDISSIIILLLIFFGTKRFRNPATWIISLITAFGYYSSFWIGTPFLSELSAPHWKAELIHSGMALFTFLAILVGRKEFYEKRTIFITKRTK